MVNVKQVFLTIHSLTHTPVEAVLPCKVLACHWQTLQDWLSWGTSHRFKTTPLITEQAEPHVRSKETEYKENSKVQA